MNHAPKSTAVFDDLIATITEIRDGYVLDTERFSEPLDVVEGYRYVGQVLSAASELFFEGDPDHPRMAPIVSPVRKLQGDNPDAIYHFARIRGDGGGYRISGNRGHACYISFTVHGRAADGGMAGPLLGDVNDQDFAVRADGSYELVLSADERPGNWLRLHPDAHAVVVRSYFELPVSAQNDPSVAVNIDIEPLVPGAPPAPLDDDTFAERFAEGVAFVRQATLGQSIPGASKGIPFVAEEPNTLPVPFSFRDSGLPVPGAADIFYAMGRWELGPDEALVMTGRIPEGVFANVMLWNRHMQTLEYRDRRSALNRRQIRPEDDGTFRIVVAHRDPGVPNWLDTDGHARGTIFWRFLLPDTDPEAIACAVVALDELSD
jgi:hypothetical protein